MASFLSRMVLNNITALSVQTAIDCWPLLNWPNNHYYNHWSMSQKNPLGKIILPFQK